MKLATEKIKMLFLVIIHISLCVQVLTIRGIEFHDPFFIKVGHLVSLTCMLVLLILNRFKLKIRQDSFLVFFVFAILYSVVLYVLTASFNKLVFNYLFIAILILIGFQLSDIPYEKLIKSLRVGALIIILLVSAKNLILIDKILSFLKSPYGHPHMPYLFGGGPNLEATWLSINLALFIGKRKQLYPLSLITILTSSVYASRAGVILSVFVILFHIFLHSESKAEKITFGIFILMPISFFILYNFQSLVTIFYFLERFSTIGNDVGSNERLIMWGAGFKSFIDGYFLGYGAGNAINLVNQNIKYDVMVNNVHNYYLQVAMDFGIIGFILFLLAILVFFVSSAKSKNVIKYAFYLYLIGCFFQFRGAEPIIWFLYALMNRSKINE